MVLLAACSPAGLNEIQANFVRQCEGSFNRYSTIFVGGQNVSDGCNCLVGKIADRLGDKRFSDAAAVLDTAIKFEPVRKKLRKFKNKDVGTPEFRKVMKEWSEASKRHPHLPTSLNPHLWAIGKSIYECGGITHQG